MIFNNMFDMKADSIRNVGLRSVETGEEITMGEVVDISNQTEMSTSEDFCLHTSGEFSCNLDAEINQEFFNQLCIAKEISPNSFEGWIEIPVRVQKRKHKKKRIDKKWLKRYGFKTGKKRVYAKEIAITKSDMPNELSSTFEITFLPNETKYILNNDMGCCK